VTTDDACGWRMQAFVLRNAADGGASMRLAHSEHLGRFATLRPSALPHEPVTWCTCSSVGARQFIERLCSAHEPNSRLGSEATSRTCHLAKPH
jgi:hypothetical protein